MKQSAAHFILPLAVAGAFFWVSADAAARAEQSPDATPVAVKTLVASEAPATQSRRFFGRVSARETVDLSFEVGGYLEELNAVEGERVKRGDVLARLDEAPFKRAVERAELALVQASRDLERAQRLAESNVASRVRAEDAETARDMASVDLREARDALADATIVAPFDGLVATRITPNFSNVEQGQPIIRLHDMSEVRVEFDLPERLLTRIADPENARFSAWLPDREDPVELSFVEFHAETDRIGQSFTVTLAFGDANSAFLVPGGAVTVEAEVGSGARGVTLPASALLPGVDRRAAVMVLEPAAGDQARLRRHPVDVRSATGAHFIVEGLPDGAEVVAVGGHLLREGQIVRRYAGLTVEER